MLVILFCQKNLSLIYCFFTTKSWDGQSDEESLTSYCVSSQLTQQEQVLFPSSISFRVLLMHNSSGSFFSKENIFDIVWVPIFTFKSSDIRKSDWLHFNSTYLLRISHMFQVWLSCCLWYRYVEDDRNLCKEDAGNHNVLQWLQRGKTFGIAEIHGIIW